MADYKWKSIAPLSEDEKGIDLAAMRPLYENWRASKSRLQQSSQAQLAEFNRRLIRRLSVETGILERLYDLDRGTTEALVAHGFAEDLIPAQTSNLRDLLIFFAIRKQRSNW
jgi:hypothetical protein